MGAYIVIRPDGTTTKVPGGRKLELNRLYELIGCRTVERTDVQYEGRKRDCWIDEEGLLAEEPTFNPVVRSLAQDYWIRQGVHPSRIQPFAGTGVIWMPRG